MMPRVIRPKLALDVALPPAGSTLSHSWLRKRTIILAAVFVAALAIVVPANAYLRYIDVWSANIWWNDPAGGGALASAAESFYDYPGENWPYEYSTAEHTDNWCDCFVYLASKAWITDADWFPWVESAWDIDGYYANATQSHSTGYHVMGQYQAYYYSGWTTYFQYSPVLPN